MDRKSVTRITVRHHEACRVMPKVSPSDGFFYSHLTPMIDTFSCTPRFVLSLELVKMRNFSASEVSI